MRRSVIWESIVSRDDTNRSCDNETTTVGDRRMMESMGKLAERSIDAVSANVSKAAAVAQRVVAVAEHAIVQTINMVASHHSNDEDPAESRSPNAARRFRPAREWGDIYIIYIVLKAIPSFVKMLVYSKRLASTSCSSSALCTSIMLLYPVQSIMDQRATFEQRNGIETCHMPDQAWTETFHTITFAHLLRAGSTSRVVLADPKSPLVVDDGT
jgi:hypothetical protein